MNQILEVREERNTIPNRQRHVVVILCRHTFENRLCGLHICLFFSPYVTIMVDHDKSRNELNIHLFCSDRVYFLFSARSCPQQRREETGNEREISGYSDQYLFSPFQSSLIDVSVPNKICLSTDFQALKVWMSRRDMCDWTYIENLWRQRGCCYLAFTASGRICL